MGLDLLEQLALFGDDRLEGLFEVGLCCGIAAGGIVERSGVGELSKLLIRGRRLYRTACSYLGGSHSPRCSSGRQRHG